MSTPTDVLHENGAPPIRGSSGNDGPAPERVTVNLSSMAVGALNTVTALNDVTKTEAINKALRFYGEVTELLAKGGALYIREPGQTEQERVRIV